MRLSLSLLVAAPLLAQARPIRHARAPAAANDLLVLNFAFVLEQLETQFYTAALAKFAASDFQTAGFSSAQIPSEQFQTIMGDEAAHQKILNSSITSFGGTVISGCTFSFDSVLTDVATMAATARVVENVGVSAYLGAAHLVSDPRILEAAGSILTVEARHQTVLNILSGTGTAIPQAFDIAMSPSEVLALAGAFISGCETGIPANPALKITNTGTPAAGTLLTFSSDALPSDTSSLSCQMMVGGAVNSISLPIDKCVVPDSVNGPVAIWITNSTQPLLNNVIDRSTAQSVAGPTLAFIDAKPESMGQLIRTGAGGSGNSTDSSTISPAEASSVASASGASATAASASSGSSTSDATASSGNSTAGPDLATGPGPDGTVVVGWVNLPPAA